jgi:glycosyltransferase involved in cell wall biosynthesis
VTGSKAQKDAVALYFHRLGTLGGGAERMVCMLADALCVRNFTVHLISWDEPHAECFYPLGSGVTWHRLGFGSGVLDKLRRMSAVTKLLREHRVGVLIGFVMSGDRTIFAAAKRATAKLVAAERNAPAIYQIRYGRLQRWLSFTFLHLADRIAVQFPDYVEGYPATLRNRIEVIPNPVPCAVRRARPEQANAEGRFSLLSVSRLDSVQKRLDKLIRAFARVADNNPAWDLVIVGDGPETEALWGLALEKGLNNRLRIEKSTPDIFDTYTEAHLFAIPSRWEGFPNALAEALAHGLPAVGFRNAPGVAQLIIEGETGWLADGIDDEITLAKCLSEAMTNDAERARRGALASGSMVKYAPETQFDRWSSLIRTLIVKGGQ